MGCSKRSKEISRVADTSLHRYCSHLLGHHDDKQ
jgi:hypothetical protein